MHSIMKYDSILVFQDKLKQLKLLVTGKADKLFSSISWGGLGFNVFVTFMNLGRDRIVEALGEAHIIHTNKSIWR